MTDLCFHCGMKIDEPPCPCQEIEVDDFEPDKEFDEIEDSIT